MFNMGMWEILIVLGIMLLLFGKRIPGIARSMGQGILEFKKGISSAEEAESTQTREETPPRNP
jgi:sec-independent protein translocase protein TatA